MHDDPRWIVVTGLTVSRHDGHKSLITWLAVYSDIGMDALEYSARTSGLLGKVAVDVSVEEVSGEEQSVGVDIFNRIIGGRTKCYWLTQSACNQNVLITRDSGGFDALAAPDRIVPLPLGSAYRAARHRQSVIAFNGQSDAPPQPQPQSAIMQMAAFIRHIFRSSRGFQNGRNSSIFGQRFITTFSPASSASLAALSS